MLILKIKVKTAASFCNPVNMTLARSDCKLVFFIHEFSLYLKNFKAIILCLICHGFWPQNYGYIIVDGLVPGFWR